MFLSHDGTLLDLGLKGLASWEDGKLTQHPEVAGVQLGSFLEDREQTVWFGTWGDVESQALRDP